MAVDRAKLAINFIIAKKTAGIDSLPFYFEDKLIILSLPGKPTP